MHIARDMRKYTRFVWLVLMFAQRTAAWLQSSETVALHHREERMRLGNADYSLQQPVMSPAAADGILPTKMNRSCRRCLQITEDDSSVVPVADPPAVDDDVDVPLRPTDPEQATTTMVPPPSPPVVTNPSSQLLEPPGDLINDGKAGGLAAAGKVGITAGVGAAAGAAVLVAGLLYYLKPDIFLCCKTCVRVQVFQHTNHASKP